MLTLCYVKLYEGLHPFNNGIHLKPKSDQLVCWKISRRTNGLLSVVLMASHGPTEALVTKRYRGKPVFDAEEFVAWYLSVTGGNL